MRFALSEDQRLLQDSVNRALESVCPLSRVRRFADDSEDFAPEVNGALHDIGVSGLLIPEEYGGLGLGMLEAALVAEAMGAHVAPGRFLGSTILAPLALMTSGSEWQKGWLPFLARGEQSASVAIAEPIAGARDGAGVVARDGKLTGRTMFAIDAYGPELLIVADQSGSLHICEATEETRRMPTIDATRPLYELSFKDTPSEPLASNRGLERLRDAAWILLAADTLGAAQAMIDKAVAYAKERRQFGRVIGSYQAVKHMCAEMAAELEPARSLVWYAAYAFDHAPEEAPLMAAHAKAHLSEIGRFIARTSTEVHGGIGMTDLLGLHYWFKRIGLNRQLLGGPERVREIAARMQGLAA